ncbi:MAG: hypothetical protein PHT99_03920 [Methanoregula sp.]|nr:hypothetical protein [Methanoregula sp.]
MNGTKKVNEYRVIIRAVEALPVLVFAVACLAFSLYIRKDPLF